MTSVSIHPSGRMALSLGTDGRLYLWNLITARAAFHMKVRGEIVAWSPKGNNFAILGLKSVRYYKVSDNIAKVYQQYAHTNKLTAMAFVGEIVAFSDAIGNLGFINFDNMAVLKLKAHDGKINDIDVGSTGLLGSLSTSG